MLILQTAVPYSCYKAYADESVEAGNENTEDQDSGDSENDEQNSDEGDSTEAPSESEDPSESTEPAETEPSTEEATEEEPSESAPSETAPTDDNDYFPGFGGGLHIIDDLKDGFMAIISDNGDETPSDNDVPRSQQYVYESDFDLKLDGKFTADKSLSDNKVLRFGKEKHHVYANDVDIKISPSLNKIGNIDFIETGTLHTMWICSAEMK